MTISTVQDTDTPGDLHLLPDDQDLQLPLDRRHLSGTEAKRGVRGYIMTNYDRFKYVSTPSPSFQGGSICRSQTGVSMSSLKETEAI